MPAKKPHSRKVKSQVRQSRSPAKDREFNQLLRRASTALSSSAPLAQHAPGKRGAA
jgi:hypothetical protein